MALTEPLRSSIYLKFEQLLGTEEAAAVLAQFPNHEIGQAVTIELLGTRLSETEHKFTAQIADVRTEMAELRTELRTEMAELRTELKTEMAELRTELKTEMAELRTEVRGDIDGLRGEFEGLKAGNQAIYARLDALPAVVNRQIFTWLLPLLLTMFSLSIVVSRFGR